MGPQLLGGQVGHVRQVAQPLVPTGPLLGGWHWWSLKPQGMHVTTMFFHFIN